jgi:AcrR family transcriptional regulator
MATRRQEILEAALAAFAERGVEATTIEDIRARSGASVGSIYHHFGDKEGLADALYVEGLRDYQRGFLELLASHDDAERGVKALVRHHLRWVMGNQELARYLLRRRDVDEQELNAELAAASTAWFERHRQAGRLRSLAPDLTYVLLIGPAQELCRQWLGGRAATSPARAERPLAEAAWRALRAE